MSSGRDIIVPPRALKKDQILLAIERRRAGYSHERESVLTGTALASEASKKIIRVFKASLTRWHVVFCFLKKGEREL